MNGVLYVAYGARARRAATASIASLWQWNDIPVAVISDKPGAVNVPDVQTIQFPEQDASDLSDVALSRWAKVNMDRLSPWHHVLYLDADTRVRGDILQPFRSIEDGFDMAICASSYQGNDAYQHVGDVERAMTLQMLTAPLQYQAGVVYFSRERCKPLFRAWRKRWLEFRGQDQAALSRAMEDEHPRVWLLGRNYNGPAGSLIEHAFGKARAL